MEQLTENYMEEDYIILEEVMEMVLNNLNN